MEKPIRELRDLTGLVREAAGFPAIVDSLRAGRSATIDGAWGSAASLTAATIAQEAPATLLVVLAHAGDVDDFAEDLAGFSGIKPETFPMGPPPRREAASKAPADPDDELAPRPASRRDEAAGARLRVLKRLAGALPPRLIVASMAALLQPVPRRERIAAASRTLRVGEEVATEELARWLVERDLSRVEVVEVPGEFSLRGGILDVFPPDAPEPVRLEFFGDEIESIRPFDPETQRSQDRWESLTLTLAPDLEPRCPEECAHLADYLSPGSWVALVEPTDLHEQGKAAESRAEDPAALFTTRQVFERLLRHPSVTLAALSGDSLETTCHLRVETVERLAGDLNRVKAELDGVAGAGRVLIACHNAAEAERLAEIFAETETARAGRLLRVVGHVRAGFHLVDAHLLVIGDHELFARTDVRRPTARRRYESRAIDSFLDLNEGDLVVHVNHGIAYYRGLRLVDQSDEHGEEQLVLEFAENTRLYVPIAKIELVQKYVGGGRGAPSLSRIGSSTWEKRKKRVAEAVVDLAAELIDIQAQRASQPGIAYPAEDSHFLAEFEAAFPYTETPDQLSAIEAVKADMVQPRPMDRLICGDVGYGKTEIAMRAAFKAVDGGKQVAVLVPTTVLAEQHHRSFSSRMAEFPVTVEVINRFRPKPAVRQALERTKAGGVDILIGTHRIVQKDVQFKDLGLVIIDEEQRFGVEDKEWLKSLRSTVDVLTLSATPIPRTLHLSLLGIRDISNLETPPPDRKAIETRITRWDDAMIRRAIHRELDRDGQVYFVHNKVYDIHQIADRIKGLVPDARILVAHGQMAGEELERAMLAFVRHEADILVATTIIESGLDIPNVNTIFIHEADKHGLADLHQLRGRVGRYKHRAYAYLLLEHGRTVTPNAVKRLKAIEEFTELGAGFKIALRDLEIRGAGNILGAEQSGHIEAVGYELYCSLLEAAVRSLTNRPDDRPALDASIELAWRAYLPKAYIPGNKVKIELYRRLQRTATLDRLADFRRELIDRFGPPPPPAENLLVEAELRIRAEQWQIRRIHIEDGFAVLTYGSARRLATLDQRHPGRIRVVDERTAYVPVESDAKRPSGQEVAAALRVLLGDEPTARPPAPRPPAKPSGRDGRARPKGQGDPPRGPRPAPAAARPVPPPRTTAAPRPATPAAEAVPLYEAVPAEEPKGSPARVVDIQDRLRRRRVRDGEGDG
jgi:transcription-repair coupling factor (superfamily II helicase)